MAALRLLALMLAPALSGCAVIGATTAVVGAGITVVSTAVDVGVAVGKGVVKVGGAVIGSDEPAKAEAKPADKKEVPPTD